MRYQAISDISNPIDLSEESPIEPLQESHHHDQTEFGSDDLDEDWKWKSQIAESQSKKKTKDYLSKANLYNKSNANTSEKDEESIRRLERYKRYKSMAITTGYHHHFDAVDSETKRADVYFKDLTATKQLNKGLPNIYDSC